MLDLRRIHEGAVSYAGATYRHANPNLSAEDKPPDGNWFATGQRSLFVASGAIGVKFFIFGDHPAEQNDVIRIQRVHDVLARHGLTPRAYAAVKTAAQYPSDPRPAGTVLQRKTLACGPRTVLGLTMDVAVPAGKVLNDAQWMAFRGRLETACRQHGIIRGTGKTLDAFGENVVNTAEGILLVDIDVMWTFSGETL